MSELSDELLKKLNFVSRAGNHFLHQNNQRLTGQQRVLAILNLDDNLTQSYLQDILDLRPSSLAELLKKLETKGLIERTEDSNDKRVKKIALTDVGKEEVKKLTAKPSADLSEQFLAGLSEDEKVQLKDSLDKISNGWDDDFKEQTKNFIEPMDRFEKMQKVRESMLSKYGDDFDNMSPEEMKDFRKEMRQQMKDMGFSGRGPMHHGHRPMEHMHGGGPFGGPMGHSRRDFRFDGMS